MGKLKINAKNTGGLITYFKIYIDGELIGKVKRNSSEIFEIKNGRHMFKVKDSGAFKCSEEKEINIKNEEIIAFNVSSNGFTYSIIQDSSKRATFDNKNMFLCSGLTDELNEIIGSFIDKGEVVYVAVQGAFREYLICTNKNVYIIKKGYMTGHLLGEGNFHIPYNKITNVEIDIHLLTGYFEISTGGLENKRLNYWSNNLNEDPAKQPNCISLNNEVLKNFEKARDFILNYEVNNNSNSNTKIASDKTIPEQIREYKALMDDGIISKEEFEEKKKELLNK